MSIDVTYSGSSLRLRSLSFSQLRRNLGPWGLKNFLTSSFSLKHPRKQRFESLLLEKLRHILRDGWKFLLKQGLLDCADAEAEAISYHDMFLLIMLFVRSDQTALLNINSVKRFELESLAHSWLANHRNTKSSEGISFEEAVHWLHSQYVDQESMTGFGVSILLDDEPVQGELPAASLEPINDECGQDTPCLKECVESEGVESDEGARVGDPADHDFIDWSDPLSEKLHEILRRAISYLVHQNALSSSTAASDDRFTCRDMAYIVSIFFMSENVGVLNIGPDDAKEYAMNAMSWIRSHPDRNTGINLHELVFWLCGLQKFRDLSSHGSLITERDSIDDSDGDDCGSRTISTETNLECEDTAAIA